MVREREADDQEIIFKKFVLNFYLNIYLHNYLFFILLIIYYQLRKSILYLTLINRFKKKRIS